MSGLSAAVIVVQEHPGDEQEVVAQYGPDIAARVEAIGGDVFAIELVPLGGELFEARLMHYIDGGVPLVLTFGGTGIGPDDIVPELTSIVVERRVPGLEERLRRALTEEAAAGALERGACGLAESTLVVNLPRDLALAESGLAALAPMLPVIAERLGTIDGRDAGNHGDGER